MNKIYLINAAGAWGGFDVNLVKENAPSWLWVVMIEGKEVYVAEPHLYKLIQDKTRYRRALRTASKAHELSEAPFKTVEYTDAEGNEKQINFLWADVAIDICHRYHDWRKPLKYNYYYYYGDHLKNWCKRLFKKEERGAVEVTALEAAEWLEEWDRVYQHEQDRFNL